MAIMTYVHTYFETLTEPMFQRDERGRELFFPWGMGSRGRVVPDAATGAQIRSQMKWAWLVFFFGLIPIMGAITTLIPNIWVFVVVVMLPIGPLFLK